MAGSAPFEILAAPFTVYEGPVNEPQPDLNISPAGNWTTIGLNGDKNLTEDGVTISFEETIERFRPVGLTAPNKAFRTEEDVIITFYVADVTAETLGAALNAQTIASVTAASGVAGNKNHPLYRGLDVDELALLIQGDHSPYGDATVTWRSQYWIPRCFMDGNPAPVYKKGEPAMLELTFVALHDPTNGLGQYEAQDATAL